MDLKQSSILIVDDNVDILQAARLLLKTEVKLIVTEKDPHKIPQLLDSENFDVILLDMNYATDGTSGKEGFFWLSEIISIDPSAVVILITAYGGVEMAVKALRQGATDFILKPWQNEKLLATISSALKLKASRNQVENLKSTQEQLNSDLNKGYEDFIGNSNGIKKIFSTINKVASTDANILVLGENGTGKDVVARAIHRSSSRKNSAFIKVDLGALSEDLFESELFGHVRGAFTGAQQDRAGRFETASGGTIFLDEIGNLSMALQVKLLSVLQNREVTRLGSNKVIPIDARLICATNMKLYEMVAENTFRQDLLYRINTVEINLPPLRERKEDIPLLTQHFLNLFNKKYLKKIKKVSTGAINKLMDYQWPGNIRELQHTMERSVIMSETEVLKESDFILSTTERKTKKMEFDNYNLDDVEKHLIQKALSKHNGNISHASKELGLTRAALYRRLEKYGI